MSIKNKSILDKRMSRKGFASWVGSLTLFGLMIPGVSAAEQYFARKQGTDINYNSFLDKTANESVTGAWIFEPSLVVGTGTDTDSINRWFNFNVLAFQAGVDVSENEFRFSGTAFDGTDDFFGIDTNGIFKFYSGIRDKTTRVTTTYTILITDKIIFGNTDGGAYTVTLPAGIQGQLFRIINSGDSGNDLTLTPDGTEHLIGVNSSFTIPDGNSLTINYDTTDGWY